MAAMDRMVNDSSHERLHPYPFPPFKNIYIRAAYAIFERP